MQTSGVILISKEMKIEKANRDVRKLEATLDELLLALRKFNTKRGRKSEEALRLNQETRVLLEQIHSSLKAA
jgi:hypothetical protein